MINRLQYTLIVRICISTIVIHLKLWLLLLFRPVIDGWGMGVMLLSGFLEELMLLGRAVLEQFLGQFVLWWHIILLLLLCRRYNLNVGGLKHANSTVNASIDGLRCVITINLFIFFHFWGTWRKLQWKRCSLSLQKVFFVLFISHLLFLYPVCYQSINVRLIMVKCIA